MLDIMNLFVSDKSKRHIRLTNVNSVETGDRGQYGEVNQAKGSYDATTAREPPLYR
jgi:hypothetical protein